MQKRLFLLAAGLAGCGSPNPDALALQQALTTVHHGSPYHQAEFGAVRRGLSEKGQVGVCGTLIDDSGRSRDFVATLGPGPGNVLVDTGTLPAGMIERLTDSVCGPDSAARYETAKRNDAGALVERIEG